MPRNKCWNKEEDHFITGVLKQYGDKPLQWSEEVWAMTRERLANRSKSGIYQEAMKLIKGRNMTQEAPTALEQGFFSAQGA